MKRSLISSARHQTKKHFASIPGLPPYHPSVYAAQPGQVRSFASSNAVEVMVMTIQSFRGEQNIIRKSDEGNAPPIHLLQAVRPVLILDEPQNMESEGGVAALAALNPLFALRYSATHRNPYIRTAKPTMSNSLANRGTAVGPSTLVSRTVSIHE